VSDIPATGLETAASPPRHVLVVANQTAGSPALIAELREQATRGTVRFHLVIPALNTRLRHWMSDIDDAVAAAHRLGEHALAVLASHQIAVSAEIGDSVPLLAIHDALAQFTADEIVISTLPADTSNWLEGDLVARARREFQLPVRHVIDREQPALAARRLSAQRGGGRVGLPVVSTSSARA
jgi:GABA permease